MVDTPLARSLWWGLSLTSSWSTDIDFDSTVAKCFDTSSLGFGAAGLIAGLAMNIVLDLLRSVIWASLPMNLVLGILRSSTASGLVQNGSLGSSKCWNTWKGPLKSRSVGYLNALRIPW
jgi:hypothetical protein